MINERLLQLKADGVLTEETYINHTFHINRYQKTLDTLEPLNFNYKKVLELGNHDIASIFIREKFNTNIYTNTTTDLRNKLPFKDKTFDFILATEVFEHINDRDYKVNPTFSGIKKLFSECQRILKPLGMLFLTTPNSIGLSVIVRAIQNTSSWFYKWHYREYTPKEIIEFGEGANLRLKFLETDFYGCNLIENNKLYSDTLKFIQSKGYSIINRGDLIIAVFERKEEE